MPRYGVTLPITGSVYVEVEADSEEAAIDAALACEKWPEPSWEVHRYATRGNVYYGDTREAEASGIDG